MKTNPLPCEMKAEIIDMEELPISFLLDVLNIAEGLPEGQSVVSAPPPSETERVIVYGRAKLQALQTINEMGFIDDN